MTPFALSLDACVLLQWNTFRFSQAPSKLSLAVKELHSPQQIVAFWTLTTFCIVNYTGGSQNVIEKRPKSRRLFVPAVRNFFCSLSEIETRSKNLTLDGLAINRMHHERLPKQILHAKVNAERGQSIGRPRKRWLDWKGHSWAAAFTNLNEKRLMNAEQE